MSELVIGVDLGGTNVRVGAGSLAEPSPSEVPAGVDGSAGWPNAEVSAATAAGPGLLVAQIADLARKVAGNLGTVKAMAVGVPGVVVPAGARGIDLAPNLPGLGKIDLAAALAEQLDVPVVLENDVNLATLGEHRHGRAQGISNFAFISIGTGIGMGVVAGGVLQRGTTGAAGEIGFLPLGGDPFDPGNQVHGPLEEAAAGVGVARRYAEADGDATGAITALEVSARAQAGDPRAVALIEEQVRVIALAVQAVHSILDPALVVFGGGIGNRPDFVSRVRDYVARLTRRPPRIETSRLGDRAGMIGAIALARSHAGDATARSPMGAPL